MSNVQPEMIDHSARDYQSNENQNNRNDFSPPNVIHQYDVHLNLRIASINHTDDQP